MKDKTASVWHWKEWNSTRARKEDKPPEHVVTTNGKTERRGQTNKLESSKCQLEWFEQSSTYNRQGWRKTEMVQTWNDFELNKEKKTQKW